MKIPLFFLLFACGCGNFPEKTEVLSKINTAAIECRQLVMAKATNPDWVLDFAAVHQAELAKEASRLATGPTYDDIEFKIKAGNDFLYYRDSGFTYEFEIKYGGHHLTSERLRSTDAFDLTDSNLCVDATYCLTQENTYVRIDDINRKEAPFRDSCQSDSMTYEHLIEYHSGGDMSEVLHRETMKLTMGIEHWFAEATVVQSQSGTLDASASSRNTGIVCHNDRCRGESALNLGVSNPYFSPPVPDFVQALEETIRTKRKALEDSK